jgi:hypothetical protein
MCHGCLREERVGYVEGEGGEEYKAHKNAETTAPFKSYPQSFLRALGYTMSHGCLREEQVGHVEGEGGEEYKTHKNAEKTAPFKSYPQSFFEGPVIYHVQWLPQGGASRVCRGRGWRGIQNA